MQLAGTLLRQVGSWIAVFCARDSNRTATTRGWERSISWKAACACSICTSGMDGSSRAAHVSHVAAAVVILIEKAGSNVCKSGDCKEVEGRGDLDIILVVRQASRT